MLKENSLIMFLINIGPSNGLCNGTRLICIGSDKNVIHVEITSQYATKQVFIPRILQSSPENEGHFFKYIWKQFPIRV